MTLITLITLVTLISLKPKPANPNSHNSINSHKKLDTLVNPNEPNSSRNPYNLNYPNNRDHPYNPIYPDNPVNLNNHKVGDTVTVRVELVCMRMSVSRVIRLVLIVRVMEFFG